MDELIYHYTSMTGFLGIISSGKFWASNILYQNDQSEFDLGKEKIIQYAFSLLQKTTHVGYSIETFSNEIDHDMYNNEMCSISFSQDRCSLNQFRSYGRTFPSYALGFRRNALEACFYKSNVLCEIVECVYDNKSQDDLIKLEINEVFEQADKAKDITTYEMTVAAKMISLAPRIKHKSFFEEREIRALFNYINPVREKYKFKAGQSFIVPYLEVDINLNELLQEIIVGPAPNIELALKSTKEFCNHAKTLSEKKYKISESELPYRGW